MTKPRVYNFNKENAKVYGAKGAERSLEVRKNKAGMSPEALAKKVFQEKSEKLARLLVAMALGTDGFEELDNKDRMTATLKSLEFGLGRPSAAKPEEPSKPEQAKVSIV